MYMQPFNQLGGPADPYAGDIARQLSVSGASSEDVIASLRSMNLGDNFWMYSFKVRLPPWLLPPFCLEMPTAPAERRKR